MAVQRETELYPPIKRFLEGRGYSVKSEVRSCDIVAVHPGRDEPVIVEMKKSFNLPLLFQGMDRLKLTPYVYLAVERNRAKKGAHNQRWIDIEQLCRRLGLGFMTVTFFKTKQPIVEVFCEPGDGVASRTSKVKTARLLSEFRERSGDYNVGGSANRKLVTAYREQALCCAHYLKVYGTLKPRELRELTGSPKAASILQRDYYGWFERTRRGVYRLTPAGETALIHYDVVIKEHLSVNR